MIRHRSVFAACGLSLILSTFVSAAPPESETSRIALTEETLRDKVRGGLLGQLLGNLNGLEHENKYIAQPGAVESYVPALPDGAWTDDDTDFEWVYILEMQRQGTLKLPPEEIARMWRERINRRIWCANQYARQLMEIGLTPPLTGRTQLNPWASFNISGQFLCETFGLLAPAMPQTASEIALHYTTVAIDQEPAQGTQLFASMIATAFIENDLDRLLDAGVASIDPKSELREIVADVRQWHRQHPEDWRATRQLIKDKYARHNGTVRDFNGHELNTAGTIAALLYGQGDLPETLRHAFNFGWDCDNNAATAGTIVGVMTGYRAMLARGWQITDRYKNTTRDEMPEDETITSFADRILDLAELNIMEQGGTREFVNGNATFHIPSQKPALVLPLADLDAQLAEMRESLRPEIDAGLHATEDALARARAAYLGICLKLDEELATADPQAWKDSLAALEEQWRVVQAMYFHNTGPDGEAMRRRAAEAGLTKPAKSKPLW